VDVAFRFITMHFKPTVLADAHHLPFKDGSFELVKASHLLEHLKNPPKALDEILRVATKEVVLKFPTELDVLPCLFQIFFCRLFPYFTGHIKQERRDYICGLLNLRLL
jgi:ubiquinone/menaquinone biosynthesis C-methylase UbiE